MVNRYNRLLVGFHVLSDSILAVSAFIIAYALRFHAGLIDAPKGVPPLQQYLIVGWGGMFPLFGRTPAFAMNHTPRFPVAMPPPPDPSTRPAKAPVLPTKRETSATKTIRPRERGRQGRRGRRR